VNSPNPGSSGSAAAGVPSRRGEHRADREDDEREAELGDPVQRQRWGAAALGPVEQQRRHPVQLGRHTGDVVLGRRRLDEQRVRARLGEGPTAGDRLVQSVHRGGVGAGDDHEVRILPRLDRGAHLADHLVGVDDRLAAHVSALLRQHLVLQVDAGHSRLLVQRDGAQHVDRVAVAGVGVGDHRDVDRRRHPPRVVDHLGAGQQADVGAADQRRRRPEAGHVDDVEPGLLDQPGGERVVRTGRDQWTGRGEQLAQPRTGIPAVRQQISHAGQPTPGMLVLCFSWEAQHERRGGGSVPRTSAGILLYRRSPDGLEVLIGHMGGPFWARKDDGAWSIPKGEYGEGEEPESVARREFEEELGSPVPAADLAPLGEVKASGKVLIVWAAEGDLDAQACTSNTFELEWPPRSGRVQEFPEIDRAAWVPVDVARTKLVKGQVPFLDRLLAAL
jgi:predicted NUDIX family NTP pyrophosphohydrolase